MKYIIAIVQPDRLEEVMQRLEEKEIHLVTVTSVMGRGRQKGVATVYRSHKEAGTLLRKMKLEIAVNSEFVKSAVDAIIEGGRTGQVGDVLVPMPHFGLVLALPDWQALAQRLQAAKLEFVMEPQIRFAGQSGEQWTMFFLDPSGNPIEVKGFASLDTVYAP